MIYIAAGAFLVAIIALRVAIRAERKVTLCQQQLVKQLVAIPEAIAEEKSPTKESPPPSGPDVPGDVLWDVCGPWVDQARKEAGWR